MTQSTALTVPDKLTTEDRTELLSEASRASEGMKLLGAFAIQNNNDYVFAGELLQDVKSRWKALETRRTAITGPLNKAFDEVQTLFKPAQDPLKRAEIVLKDKIEKYVLAQREANEAQMRAAAAAVQVGASPAPHVAAMTPAVIVPGISVKEGWDFEVVDAALVPRQYLKVDMDKIRAAIWYADTPNPPLPIPGIRFVRTGQVTARAAK